MALSSTEAEYIALTSTIQEGIWLQQLAREINYPLLPTTIYCDNQSAKLLATSSGFKDRTKHIDIRHHFIREKIQNNIVKVNYINTNENLADVLTKAVTKEKLEYCAIGMGLKCA